MLYFLLIIRCQRYLLIFRRSYRTAFVLFFWKSSFFGLSIFNFWFCAFRYDFLRKTRYDFSDFLSSFLDTLEFAELAWDRTDFRFIVERRERRDPAESGLSEPERDWRERVRRTQSSLAWLAASTCANISY